MLKYLKYEMKNTSKFIIMLLAAIIVSSLALQKFFLSSINYAAEPSDFIAIPILIIFGSFLVYFVFTVNLMKRDLYEDKGYLTFNLPLRGISPLEDMK